VAAGIIGGGEQYIEKYMKSSGHVRYLHYTYLTFAGKDEIVYGS
jgi:hypothetical protein